MDASSLCSWLEVMSERRCSRFWHCLSVLCVVRLGQDQRNAWSRRLSLLGSSSWVTVCAKECLSAWGVGANLFDVFYSQRVIIKSSLSILESAHLIIAWCQWGRWIFHLLIIGGSVINVWIASSNYFPSSGLCYLNDLKGFSFTCQCKFQSYVLPFCSAISSFDIGHLISDLRTETFWI